jgi:hypothetical protein
VCGREGRCDEWRRAEGEHRADAQGTGIGALTTPRGANSQGVVKESVPESGQRIAGDQAQAATVEDKHKLHREARVRLGGVRGGARARNIVRGKGVEVGAGRVVHARVVGGLGEVEVSPWHCGEHMATGVVKILRLAGLAGPAGDNEELQEG